MAGDDVTQPPRDREPSRRATSSLRRLACDACRTRKVRCDGRDVKCGRCARLGLECRYSGQRKVAGGERVDMSKLLEKLDDRLKQAEEQMAAARLTQREQPRLVATPLTDKATESLLIEPVVNTRATNDHMDSLPLGLTPERELDATMADQNVTEWFNDLDPGISEPVSFDPFETLMPAGQLMAQTFLSGSDTVDIDSIFLETSSSSTNQSISAVPASALQKLHETFFDAFHPVMPIINRARFQSEIYKPSPSTEVQVLSFAIGAVTATSVPELRCYVEQCYEQARSLLDLCERQESGESLSNINIIQACTILAFLELQRPNFGRALLTIGRAINLVKLMGLDKAEESAGTGMGGGQRGLQMQRLLPTDLAEKEEGRRVFWVLYILDAFASLRTNASSAFGKWIFVPLPSPSEYPDYSNHRMPSLLQVYEPSETASLSSFAATAIMISLYQRCFEHVQSSSNDKSYAFWEAHYDIEKSLKYCHTTLLAQHLNGNSGDDPLALSTRMNMNAVVIILHETAVSRVKKEGLPDHLHTESTSRCVAGVVDISKAADLCLRLPSKSLERLRKLDGFLIWPIRTAIHVCFRMPSDLESDGGSSIDLLRILSKAMRGLVDAQNITPGLLEMADAKVAEAEQAAKRS